MEYLRAQKDIYKGRYCSSVSIHQMDGQDPYASQLKAFVNSAQNATKKTTEQFKPVYFYAYISF